jgi:hypothetical protein
MSLSLRISSFHLWADARHCLGFVQRCFNYIRKNETKNVSLWANITNSVLLAAFVGRAGGEEIARGRVMESCTTVLFLKIDALAKTGIELDLELRHLVF